LNLPFFIARRGLTRQQGGFSSFIIKLAIVATALSVAVMVLAIAFIQGFKYEVREKIFSFWGHVVITNYSQDAADFNLAEAIRYDPHLVEQVKRLSHVEQVIPFIVRPAILKTPTDMEGIKLKGISNDYSFADRVGLEGEKISFSDTDYSREIILSQSTANKLNLKLGDDLQLYFIEKGNTTPRIRKVKLTGIFHTGMEEVDKSYALCDIRMLQRINNWSKEEINGYQVDLEEEKYMDAVSDRIFQDYLEAPLHSYTMKEVYINVFDWLQLQNLNAQIVLIIMAVVATINLAVATVILIVEQSKLIGILKALGMRFHRIMQLFMYHAVTIAFFGILSGNVLALAICFLQLKTGFLKLDETTYYMSQVPVRIHFWDVLWIDLATLMFCMLFMWLPTLYIRRIQPVKVLQFK
jgi:lipoprotein-releasing system permease protein